MNTTPHWFLQLKIPGSKSITNRALILAALATGESTLYNPLEAEDIIHLRKVLLQLGVPINFQKKPWKIKGTTGIFQPPKNPLYLGDSGTGIRFSTALASLLQTPTTLTGSERLEQRPIQNLLTALSDLGVQCSISKSENQPLTITGPLKGGPTTICSSLSSQYISALLMVAPYAKTPVTLEIEGEQVSWPYVELTLELMRLFGISVQYSSTEKKFQIPQGHYQGTTLEIEADCSSASYFLAAAGISEGKLMISNWNKNTVQGDRYLLTLLAEMGCKFQETLSTVTLEGPPKLKAVQLEMKFCPDLVPVAAILATQAKGTSRFTGIAHLQIKESNRLTALANELQKCGIRVQIGEDWIEIEGGELKPALIHCYRDHRIAMSFAVAQLCCPKLEIEDQDCVKKSFPTFWQLWNPLQKAKSSRLNL